MTKRAIAKKLSKETIFPAKHIDVDALCKAACVRPRDVLNVDVWDGCIMLWFKDYIVNQIDDFNCYSDSDGKFLYIARFLK